MHTYDIAMGFLATFTLVILPWGFMLNTLNRISKSHFHTCQYHQGHVNIDYMYIHYVYVYVHMLIYGDQRHHTKCPKTNQMMNLYPKYVIHIYTYKTIIKMIYIHLYICYTCMLIYSHVHININICICIYTYMCIYVYIYTCIYTCIHTCLYTCIYMCVYK